MAAETILGRSLNIDDAFSSKCYGRSYEAFHAWVESTIEQIRREACVLLFPVFAHAYLRIVNNGKDEEKEEFLERWSDEHSCHELWKPLTCGKLSSSPKFVCRISGSTALLVSEFLSRTSNVCVVQILNENVTIEVGEFSSGCVLVEKQEEPVVVLSEKEAKKTSVGFHQQLKLGVLAESVDEARQRNSADDLPVAFFDRDPDDAANAYASALLARSRRPSKAGGLSRGLLSALDPTALALTLVEATTSLSCCKPSKDARRLAAGFVDASIRVYKVDSLAVDPRRREAEGGGNGPTQQRSVAHIGPVYSVDWERESRYLLSGGADGCVVLWDTENGRDDEDGAASASSSALSRYRAHSSGGPCWDVRWSDLSRGHLFATAGADSTARIFATDRVDPCRILVGHWSDVSKCAWHPNAHYLLTGSYDKQCRLWDLRAGKTCRILQDAHSPVTAIDLSPDGLYAAAACENGSVHVWSLDAAKKIASFAAAAATTAPDVGNPPRGGEHGQASEQRRAGVDDNAEGLAQKNAAITNKRHSQKSNLVQPSSSFSSPKREKKNPVYSVSFSSDGEVLAAGGKDQTLRIFNSIDQDDSLVLHHNFKTKATPIFDLTWTNANLCLVSGALLA